MASHEKEQAEVLRLGLLAGIRSVADVIAWADNAIATNAKPGLAVIDIAASHGRPASIVSALLRDVPGDYDRSAVYRWHIAELREALHADPGRGSEIAGWLYQLVAIGELPEGVGDEPYALKDWFDLARLGAYGTFAEALENLERYLAREERQDVGADAGRVGERTTGTAGSGPRGG